jgi:hypothetical protein
MIGDDRKFRLNWLVFLISFGIGILYIYTTTPAPKVVLKFPSPYNAGKVVYHDKSNECFVFEATRVDCPKNAKKQPAPEF